jgi:xanthine/CO dehydrogenase XdhC/CoxF family maturation factor
VLTDGEDEAERPDFEEDGGGPPWWPARSPCGGDVPVLGWRQGAAQKVWLAVLERTAATACSGGHLVRRDGAAELGS